MKAKLKFFVIIALTAGLGFSSCGNGTTNVQGSGYWPPEWKWNQYGLTGITQPPGTKVKEFYIEGGYQEAMYITLINANISSFNHLDNCVDANDPYLINFLQSGTATYTLDTWEHMGEDTKFEMELYDGNKLAIGVEFFNKMEYASSPVPEIWDFFKIPGLPQPTGTKVGVGESYVENGVFNGKLYLSFYNAIENSGVITDSTYTVFKTHISSCPSWSLESFDETSDPSKWVSTFTNTDGGTAKITFYRSNPSNRSIDIEVTRPKL